MDCDAFSCDTVDTMELKADNANAAVTIIASQINPCDGTVRRYRSSITRSTAD